MTEGSSRSSSRRSYSPGWGSGGQAASSLSGRGRRHHNSSSHQRTTSSTSSGSNPGRVIEETTTIRRIGRRNTTSHSQRSSPLRPPWQFIRHSAGNNSDGVRRITVERRNVEESGSRSRRRRRSETIEVHSRSRSRSRGRRTPESIHIPPRVPSPLSSRSSSPSVELIPGTPTSFSPTTIHSGSAEYVTIRPAGQVQFSTPSSPLRPRRMSHTEEDVILERGRRFQAEQEAQTSRHYAAAAAREIGRTEQENIRLQNQLHEREENDRRRIQQDRLRREQQQSQQAEPTQPAQPRSILRRPTQDQRQPREAPRVVQEIRPTTTVSVTEVDTTPLNEIERQGAAFLAQAQDAAEVARARRHRPSDRESSAERLRREEINRRRRDEIVYRGGNSDSNRRGGHWL